MAIPRPEETSSTQISLIHTSQQEPSDTDETQLNDALKRLETFLRFFGFCQYSPISFILSWLAFIVVGIVLPVLLIELLSCSNCAKYEIRTFELEILVCQSIAAAVSLLCVSHNLRKYGVRKFLFVDRCHGHMTQFRVQYIRKIDSFFRLMAIWILPCLFIKTAREIIHIVFVYRHSWWQSVVILIISLVSWTYSTIIYLSGSVLFNLVSNLQVIHFENYGKLLERDLDVAVYIEEHIRLRHHLSKISHRFRIYLLLEFLVVTASQFVSLLETTGNHNIINFINGGDFIVSSIVQLVGIIICLNAAAKISHRAQGIASVASRWHAIVTCNSSEASRLGSSSDLDAFNPVGLLPISYSESDLDSMDYVPVPTNSQLAMNVSSYHKRQAFVMYLQSNPGGATVFGWTVDHTIFFVEMSLVLFVLGKTITFSTK